MKRTRRHVLSLLALLPLCACPAAAQERADRPGAKEREEQQEGDEAGGKALPRPVPTQMDEVTITAARRRQLAFDSPRFLTVAGLEELRRENQISILDSLTGDKPGIWVEKRTMTGSNPVIRGFSGANIMALVDGCSITTMWGEGGMTCN